MELNVFFSSLYKRHKKWNLLRRDSNLGPLRISSNVSAGRRGRQNGKKGHFLGQNSLKECLNVGFQNFTGLFKNPFVRPCIPPHTHPPARRAINRILWVPLYHCRFDHLNDWSSRYFSASLRMGPLLRSGVDLCVLNVLLSLWLIGWKWLGRKTEHCKSRQF